MIVVFVIDTSPSMGQPLVPPTTAPLAPISSNASLSSTSSTSGTTSMLSKLDLAKMAVEDLVRGMNRRLQEHNGFLQQQSPAIQKALHNIGLGVAHPCQYLLLSTGRQHVDQPATAACGAGGRLLVGYHHHNSGSGNTSTGAADSPHDGTGPDGTADGGPAHSNVNATASGSSGGNNLHATHTASFQRELKQLRATVWSPDVTTTGTKKQHAFPEDGGGAVGLNAALSAGLQLISRYRLQDRTTEHFGMGRLPSCAVMSPAQPNQVAVNALQSACLIVLTDGACLRKPPSEGGGSLQLQYGTMPLKDLYQEPFRWDQRVMCIGVGGSSGSGSKLTSTQYLHPHLRALCEVTGGYHTMLPSTMALPSLTDRLLKLIAPPLPRELPLPDPLADTKLTSASSSASGSPPWWKISAAGANGSSPAYVHAGPVCCFQALEGDLGGESGGGGGQGTVYRAMLLTAPFQQPELLPESPSADQPLPDMSSAAPAVMFASPLWCIPESYVPSKKLDTLPPRRAQPSLMISRLPAKLGPQSFEPVVVMKQLQRLDQLVLSNRQAQALQASDPTPSGQQSSQPPPPGGAIKLLHRDVYVCEWISVDDRPPKAPQPSVYGGTEYFPVFVPVTGMSEDPAGVGGNSSPHYFHIGILHVPPAMGTLAFSASSKTSTLTLLPPEPHILLPLLVKAADAESRALKKLMPPPTSETGERSTTPPPSNQNLAVTAAAISRTIGLDEGWKNELKNYMARLPPYYQPAIKRALRSVLPASALPLLTNEASTLVGGDISLPLQCFSKLCFQKIRNGEQVARDINERTERQEADLRGVQSMDYATSQHAAPQQVTTNKQHPTRATGAAGSSGATEIGYGQYDPRSSTESFLSALRNMPAPWLVGAGPAIKKRKAKPGVNDHDGLHKHSDGSTKTKDDGRSAVSDALSVASDVVSPTAVETKANNKDRAHKRNIMEVLGDLPADCLMAYYESRRRWIFGGSGLTTRGLMVEGVTNDGSNSQRCGADPDAFLDKPLLAFAGVGVSSLNETTTAKMGDYRERLLWSRSPVVSYGSNDSVGVAANTAADGSPKWSVDDDAMPISFFDPKTGEFADSVQARVRSRLMVNFGNPYRDKRADSLVPEKFLSQCPSSHQHVLDCTATPPGSPPHDSFSSGVEEGEALFTKSPPGHSLGSPRPRSPRGSQGGSLDGDSAVDSDVAPPPPPMKRSKPDGVVPGENSLPSKPQHLPPKRQSAKASRPERVACEANKAWPSKMVCPSTPTTPPVAPPKVIKTSPGSNSPARPPPPPLKSPKPTPGPPPKGLLSRKPPPPVAKPPPPPPSLDKKLSFTLAPSKPLPSLPLKRPSSTLLSGQGPPPPVAPKPPQLEAAANEGVVVVKGPPPPPMQQQQQLQPPPPPPPRRGSTSKPPPPKPLEYTNAEKKPNVELPSGWMCVWSKSQRRWYFFDTRSNKSVWEWPPPTGA